MNPLENWLQQATRHLAKESAAQVRIEIREHYESARESAMSDGATAGEADSLALAALGDAHDANVQYRAVLLTAAETRLLRDGNWEARAFCSYPWLKWALLAVPVAALWIAISLFLMAGLEAARIPFAAVLIISPLLAALFLPIYTPARGRVFRCVKWVLLVGGLVLAFGPHALKWSWLLTSCIWPVAWIEWKRIVIRRKLRVAEWPKQLYL
jgi:hypothetical protein